jgi:hypothetical protein
MERHKDTVSLFAQTKLHLIVGAFESFCCPEYADPRQAIPAAWTQLPTYSTQPTSFAPSPSPLQAALRQLGVYCIVKHRFLYMAASQKLRFRLTARVYTLMFIANLNTFKFITAITILLPVLPKSNFFCRRPMYY